MNFIKTVLSLKLDININTVLPGILFISMLPHLLGLSPVFVLYVVIILSWYSFHTLGFVSLPGRLIRFLLFITALTLLLFSYGISFSQTTSLTLLCLMIALKLFEIQHENDKRNIFLSVYLGYFVLLTHFLYSQSFFSTIFIFFNTYLLTFLLFSFNRKPAKLIQLNSGIRILNGIFLKALPLAILLFLFFPRVPGPLWSLPDDSASAKTGLSDKMYPGSVTTLVDSNEIAFRVKFNGTIPDSKSLYWRGPVLSETDGFLWSQKKTL